MKSLMKKFFFPDRTLLVLLTLIVAVFIFISVTLILTKNINSENNALMKEVSDIESRAEGVILLKNLVESKEKKIGLTKSSGVVSAIGQILKSLNMEASKIKPLEKKKVEEFMEEKAELEIINTDLNSIVNLLYKIDNSPILMKINSASVETTFEDPDKFILKLSISHLSKG